jgi:hypothetical protein
LPALLAVPSQPAAVQYTLCIGAHNGRTFVGPQLLLQQLQVQPSLGCLILRPDSTAGSQQQQQLQLDWVPADELVVLVVELLATPVGAAVDQVCIMPTSGCTSSHHIQAPASSLYLWWPSSLTWTACTLMAAPVAGCDSAQAQLPSLKS